MLRPCEIGKRKHYETDQSVELHYAGGRHQSYNGSGVKPASGQIDPGLVPSECEGTIGSTGCQATLKVYFLKGQD